MKGPCFLFLFLFILLYIIFDFIFLLYMYFIVEREGSEILGKRNVELCLCLCMAGFLLDRWFIRVLCVFFKVKT